MSDEEAAHSQCVSLRLDPSTLKAIEDNLQGATLSVGLGVSINNTLRALVK
jgi:hypothetical protein